MRKSLGLMLAFILFVSYSPSQWLQAQVVGDTVTLTWIPPTEDINNQPLLELSGYRLYESATPGGPYTKIADPPAGTVSYLLTPAEGLHYYVMTAWNSGGESVYSNEVAVTINGVIVRPKAPGSLAASW